MATKGNSASITAEQHEANRLAARDRKREQHRKSRRDHQSSNLLGYLVAKSYQHAKEQRVENQQRTRAAGIAKIAAATMS